MHKAFNYCKVEFMFQSGFFRISISELFFSPDPWDSSVNFWTKCWFFQQQFSVALLSLLMEMHVSFQIVFKFFCVEKLLLKERTKQQWHLSDYVWKLPWPLLHNSFIFVNCFILFPSVSWIFHDRFWMYKCVNQMLQSLQSFFFVSSFRFCFSLSINHKTFAMIAW